MTCEEVIEGEIVEKYLHEQLSEESRDAFEQHYFECSRCFGLLRTYRDLQAELAKTRQSTLADAPQRHWIWRWAWVPATAVVVLATSLALWQRPAPDVAQPAAVVQPSTPAPSGPGQATPGPSLSDLARIDPPRYSPSQLRGVEDEATARYQEAMKRYAQGDYAEAVGGLSAASKLDPEAPHVLFFLGISYLMSGQPDAGINALRRTIALGDSPFAEDAHYFLAKASLQKRELATAEKELARTIELRGEREAEARQLLGQLRDLAKQVK